MLGHGGWVRELRLPLAISSTLADKARRVEMSKTQGFYTGEKALK